MQSTLIIPVSAALQQSLKQHTANKTDLLIQVIHDHADQIGYMLQSYYSREKVSQVIVIPDSVRFNGSQTVILQLQYVMEEFNACSAVDTLQKEKMNATIDINLERGELNLKGEYWPER